MQILLCLASLSFEALCSSAHPVFPRPQIQLCPFIPPSLTPVPALTLFIFNTLTSSIHSCCPILHLGAELPYKKQITCLHQEESNFMLFLMSSYVQAQFQIKSWWQKSVSPVSRSLKMLLGYLNLHWSFWLPFLVPLPLLYFVLLLEYFLSALIVQVSFSVPLSLTTFVLGLSPPHFQFLHLPPLHTPWFQHFSLLLFVFVRKLSEAAPLASQVKLISIEQSGKYRQHRGERCRGELRKIGSVSLGWAVPSWTVVAFWHCAKIWKMTETSWKKSACALQTLPSPFTVTLPWWEVAACSAPWGASSATLCPCIGYCESMRAKLVFSWKVLVPGRWSSCTIPSDKACGLTGIGVCVKLFCRHPVEVFQEKLLLFRLSLGQSWDGNVH